MANPLDDPRSGELLAAQPDDVNRVAAQFRAAGAESEMTAAGLAAAREDGVWTGHAADSFRRAVGPMPGELRRVQAGYSAVAAALTAYEPELSRIQSVFRRVIADLADAETQLQTARATAREAHSAIVVDRRTAEVATLTAMAFQLLDEFSAVRGNCRDAVSAAQRTAPVEPVDAVSVPARP